jgi:hypothetical protein
MTDQEIVEALSRFLALHEAQLTVTQMASGYMYSNNLRVVHMRNEDCSHVATALFFIDDYQERKDEYLRIVATELITLYAKARYLR